MCGIFGTMMSKGAASATTLTVLGLHALQHRGQQAGGIVSFDGHTFHQEYTQGKIGDHFSHKAVIETLEGYAAIGHVRYATSGSRQKESGDLAVDDRDLQPLFKRFDHDALALAHNGNLTNYLSLRHNLSRQGVHFTSAVDTEIILNLIDQESPSLPDSLIQALKQVQGSFSLIALSQEYLIGIRDPYGVRPLILGQNPNAWILASETCALDITDASFVREIEPGEMILITPTSVESRFPFQPRKRRFCIFEYIYFSRPDSQLSGLSVYESRKRMGRILAQEAPTPNADIVIPIPDSGVPAALGYAEASALPYELGIIRNHYVGRTFIEPTQKIRHFGLKLKHSVNRRVVEGKTLVVVDDSLVRGNTLRSLIEQLRGAGAREIHIRISSPPIKHSCFYGIDTPRVSEILAHQKSNEEIRRYINSETLEFLTLNGLEQALYSEKSSWFCNACFTGSYPIPVIDNLS